MHLSFDPDVKLGFTDCIPPVVEAFRGKEGCVSQLLEVGGYPGVGAGWVQGKYVLGIWGQINGDGYAFFTSFKHLKTAVDQVDINLFVVYPGTARIHFPRPVLVVNVQRHLFRYQQFPTIFATFGKRDGNSLTAGRSKSANVLGVIGQLVPPSPPSRELQADDFARFAGDAKLQVEELGSGIGTGDLGLNHFSLDNE